MLRRGPPAAWAATPDGQDRGEIVHRGPRAQAFEDLHGDEGRDLDGGEPARDRRRTAAPGSRRVSRPRNTIASDAAAVTAARRPAVVRYPWPVAGEHLVTSVRIGTSTQIGEPVAQQQPGRGHAQDRPRCGARSRRACHDCRLGADIGGRGTEDRGTGGRSDHRGRGLRADGLGHRGDRWHAWASTSPSSSRPRTWSTRGARGSRDPRPRRWNATSSRRTIAMRCWPVSGGRPTWGRSPTSTS